jgi:GTP-binding protein YchF
MHVVRCFGGTRVVREEAVDPARDMELIELELALADLETVNKALDRAVRQSRTGDKDALARKAAFARAEEALEQGRMLSALAWREEELALLRPLCLMTLKKMLYVANVADDDLEGTSPLARQVATRAAATGAGWVPICGDLESELRLLGAADRQAFMKELGLERLGLEKLIRAVYGVLGLQTFYTAGPKEIRAWTIKGGDTAPRAAGVIHTDFEKGFIRAQIYSVADLAECGTEAAVKAAGRLRTEGRDYLLREADVCHFLIGR